LDVATKSEPLERLFPAPAFYDLDETLRFLPMGSYDPSSRRGPGVSWKAARTPQGPVTLELRCEADAVVARAFGPGAEWVLDRAAALLGLGDDPGAFVPPPGRLATLARRGRGLHLSRSPFVFDALIAVILQQRVAFRDAARAYRSITASVGTKAPGPPGLQLPPSPRDWLALSSEDFRRAGVDGQRAQALRMAARHARAIDATLDATPAEARARLAAVPGCGPWTVEMTMGFGFGDPDAVILGDSNLPRLVAWALAGETKADDARMQELLEPYRGHRFRLVRLLFAAGVGLSAASRSRASRR
jgi:3-methyladenine DNA glycosylase/8-oxoguanine DNA glycosylase